MGREYKRGNPSVMERDSKGRYVRRLSPKTYTLTSTYNFTNNGVKPEMTAEERHLRKMENIIRIWHEHTSSSHNISKGLHLHSADIAHFDKRAAEYFRLKERLGQLDSLKDYVDVSLIGHKLKCIREDFERLSTYSKKHNSNALDCNKQE